MDDYPDPYATGKYIAADDFSLWVKTTDQSYEHYRSDWMVTWKIYKDTDDLWHWTLIDHDAWDGDKQYDETQRGSTSGYSSWQDVARWLRANEEL